MKTRCVPGQRCVVVADVPGCECNVGATLTVTELGLGDTPAGPRPIWAFKDADRPLKVVDPVVWVTSSAGFPRDAMPGVFDHHLVPVPRGGDTHQQATREALQA